MKRKSVSEKRAKKPRSKRLKREERKLLVARAVTIVGTTSPSTIRNRVQKWTGKSVHLQPIKDDIDELVAGTQAWQEDILKEGLAQRIKSMYENINISIEQANELKDKAVAIANRGEVELDQWISKITMMNKSILDMYAALVQLTSGNTVVIEQMEKYVADSQARLEALPHAN